MAIAQRGSINCYYSPDSVSDSVANEVVEAIQHISFSYPRDGFYNLAYPKLDLNLTRLNDELGYQITLNGFGHVPDPYLKFTKELYHSLNKKYKTSIVFLDSNHNVTLDYSDNKYWKTLFQNHIISFIILPIVVIAMLALGRHLVSLINNESVVGKALLEIIPLIVGYPISFIAFKTQPMIPATKVISCIIIIISVFSFYLFTGSGLIGSLILLAIFALQSIQSSLT